MSDKLPFKIINTWALAIACVSSCTPSQGLDQSITKLTLVAKCGGKTIKLYRSDNEDFHSHNEQPQAILSTGGKKFIGPIDSYGFPRGFNLAGTLINDKSARHLPSLLWFNDGSMAYRGAGEGPELSPCHEVSHSQN